MRRLLSKIGLVLALVATGCLLGAAPAAAQTGLSTEGGAAIQESDLSGDLILVFFASWSPRCRGIAQRAAEIQQRWGSRARVALVSFQEDGATARDFVGRGGPQLWLDTDGVFSKRHSILNLPGLLVFRDGAVAYSGGLPRDAGEVLDPIFDGRRAER